MHWFHLEIGDTVIQKRQNMKLVTHDMWREKLNEILTLLYAL